MSVKSKPSWNRVIDIRDAAKTADKMGLDGVVRSQESENELNTLVASVFITPAGESLMDYLKSITLNNVTGPGIDDMALRHLEGQRFLVGILARRMEKGKEQR